MFLPSKRSSVCGLLVLFVGISHAVAFHTIVGEPPSFTVEPSDKVVFETDAQNNKVNLMLPCTATGNPQPTVTWFMGDDVMVNSQYVMDDGRLVIPNITEGVYASRQGVLYYCQASNVIGRADQNYTATIRSRKANVTYAFFEGFTQDVNSNVNVAVTSNVALRCDVGAANPPPIIEWFDDPGDNADTSTSPLVADESTIFYLENGRYLAIYGLTSQQVGRQYRCHVTNARIHQRQRSPTIFILNNSLPIDTLEEYKQIGDVTAFVTDSEVEFSYVGGSIGTGNPGIFSQCELLNGTEDLATLITTDAIGSVAMEQIPAPTVTSNEFTIRCQIGYSGGTTSRTGILRVYQGATITDSPPNNRDFVIGEEDSITFKCEAEGVPAPDIEWYINGEDTLETDSGISIDGNTLTIAQPNPSHSGMFQCAASNDFATDVSTWILELREPISPNIVDFNLTELGAEEDRDFGAVLVEPEGTSNVEFFVRVMADPCPTVQWSLNGSAIMNGSVYIISNPCAGGSSPYTFTITIVNLTEDTSGNYSAVFLSLQEEVILPRTFITIPRPVSIENLSLSVLDTTTERPCLLNNSVASLRCNVAGFPRPEVTFFRGNVQIDPGEPLFERYSMPYFDEMRIDDVRMEDDNNGFTCRTDTGGSAMMADAEFPFCTIPMIVNSSRTNEPQLGEDIFIQCSIDGVPRVSVVWRKDGQLLQTVPGKIDIVVPQTPSGTQVTSRVEVTAAAAENDGRYTCQGSNDAGVVSMDFQIQSQDSSGGLALPMPAIIGIAAGGVGLIILIVLTILLIVCVYQCALRSKRGSADMPPPYSGKMYTDYSDGRGNVDDSDEGEEEDQPEAFNPQYESLPALRPSQPPGYKPTPSYPHGVGDDLEMVKMPPPDTDSFVGGAPPYQHQDNGLPSSSYRPTVDDFVSEDAQFV